MKQLLESLRTDYKLRSLLEGDVDQNPVTQFEAWLKEAVDAKVAAPDAFCLATVNKEHVPDARMVLLKDISQNGLVFFSNYHSAKGVELAQCPHAAAVFYWPELERQIRVSGEVQTTAESISDAYFASRPRGAQLAAFASNQSHVVKSRKDLEAALEKAECLFEGRAVERPKHWGGYCLKPALFEFWQGRENRLHDRLRYRLEAPSTWVLERLAP